MGPNRLRDESPPNTSASSGPSAGPVDVTREDEEPPASTRRRANPLYAFIGVVVLFFSLSVASGGSLPLFALLGGLVIALYVGRWLLRRRSATPGGPPEPTLYEHLSDEGREASAEVVTTGITLAWMVPLVVGWAVIATVVAVAISLLAVQFPSNDTVQLIGGVGALVAFLGILIAGPILTWRWLKVRHAIG